MHCSKAYNRAVIVRFPILALLARKYLQIPTTSASCERYFSQSALNITKQRNWIHKDTFEEIICIKSWGIFKEEEEILKENQDLESTFIISN
jgi:hAT family C-terminal dimerisation region